MSPDNLSRKVDRTPQRTPGAHRARPRRAAVAIAAAAAAAIVATAAVHHAAAEYVRPDFPVTLVVGPSLGPQPMARSDVARTGRAARLPDAPRELWHRKIRGGLSLPPMVDANGSIVIAAAVAELLQMTPDGNEQWHHGLGTSVASDGPVILSDGTRVVLTSLGDAWGIGPDGSERFHADLSALGADPKVAPLPLDNGHLVVAIASNLAEIDSQGLLVDRTALPERAVGMLVASGSGVIATGDSGKVYRWQPPVAPRLVGSFGGIVRDGAILSEPGSLAAVVDASRLVKLDLSSGSSDTLLSMPGMEGPPAVGPKGVLRVAGSAGLLVGMKGPDETLRTSLNAAPPTDQGAADAGPAVPLYTTPSPPLVIDRDGRVAFVRSDGRVGVVSPTGAVRAVDKPACGSPFALVPAGDKKFLVACRNGSVKLYGE